MPKVKKVEKGENPPLGLVPRFIREEQGVSDEDRADEIVAAMDRYLDAGLDFPQEWLDKLDEINDRNPDWGGER